MVCLYRYFDKGNVLLYVGIALNPLARLQQHSTDKKWISDIDRIDIQKFETKAEALEAESLAIKKEKPLHNKAGQGSSDKEIEIKNTPSDLCKEYGLKSLRELCRMSDTSEQTLINWSKNKKKLFLLVLIGAVEYKKLK